MIKMILKYFYVHGLALYSRWQLSRAESQLLILMYHRVLPKDDPRARLEEPGMMVTPRTLAMHIDQLRRSGYTIVKLGDWLKAYQSGNPPKGTCVALTFDDGWLDNYQYAFPILRSKQAPFTLFAVSDILGKAAPFWPNQILKLLRSSNAQALLSQPLFTQLNLSEGNASPIDNELLAELISKLKLFPDEHIHQTLAPFQEQLDSADPDIINQQQMQEMLDSGLMELGCHTASHCRMHSDLSEQQLQKELIESKRSLEQQFAIPIELFCYPNGDITPAAKALASEHYLAAVSTENGSNCSSEPLPLHQLKRIALHDDMSKSAALFHAKLSTRL
ncbi:polysaccharide deacetylase family protein [Aliagarivorans taiwanensis]|uniref:polysaccharide deacetylase family protein n=1 Tax=Aliagarivorans taiwanensis TaxID=561966 RepID=UPI0004225B3B|nr:polysaccharide deacetylase family protein [Aliagarivorans taiwanensis]